MQTFDIGDLVRITKEFEPNLAKVKSQNLTTVTPGWYPYSSFASISVLDRMLKGENRKLSNLIGEHSLLDVGAGDGDLSFLFESLGAKVQAIDHPAINYNRMTGLHTLQRALNSTVDIQTLDIDSQFAMADRIYGLVLLFGVLYHLKNPFYVLEALARYSEHCLLSTRIARYSPGGRVRIESLPVAYLVDERETNNDPTNFWILTEAGLKLLIKRAGWEILEFMTTGNTTNSDPVSARGDERAFCLLRSRTTDYTLDLRLGDGWYELEQNTFRWTRASFSVDIGRPQRHDMPELSFFFYLPEMIIKALGHVGLTATVNGIPLEKHSYASEGHHVYTEKIPAAALQDEGLRIEFTVDQPFTSANDHRELGVLVSFSDRCPVAVS